MACTWAKALREQQVVSAETGGFLCLVVLVLLNGKAMDALIDTGCGCTGRQDLHSMRCFRLGVYMET